MQEYHYLLQLLPSFRSHSFRPRTNQLTRETNPAKKYPEKLTVRYLPASAQKVMSRTHRFLLGITYGLDLAGRPNTVVSFPFLWVSFVLFILWSAFFFLYFTYIFLSSARLYFSHVQSTIFCIHHIHFLYTFNIFEHINIFFILPPFPYTRQQ